jgi:hypothetical protein
MGGKQYCHYCLDSGDNNNFTAPGDEDTALYLGGENSMSVLQTIKTSNVVQSLRYSLYIPTHPFDGFWDLTHEKRGSLWAAHIIVFLCVIVEMLRETLTNFQFINVNLNEFNIIMVFLRVLLPLWLWTVANWSMTTLMDGKGRLLEIYMATSYALVPYIIINFLTIIFSQFITADEGSLYTLFNVVSIVWSALLIMAAMMQVHNYSPAKTVLSSLLAIVAMGVMIFIFLIFFTLISDAIGYFVSLYREARFRIS